MRFHPPDFFCPDHHPPIAFDMITSANSIYDPSTIIDQSPRITASVTTTRQDDDDELYLCIDGGGTKTNVSIAGRRSKRSSELGQFEGVILARGSHQSSNYTDVGLQSAILSIGEATIQALQALPDRPSLTNAKSWNYQGFQSGHGSSKPAPFSKIWAGLSGVDSDQDRVIIRDGLIKLFGLSDLIIKPESENLREKFVDDSFMSPKLKVTNDCDLLSSPIELHYRSHRKSNQRPCKGGIVLIAGTGSIATAFGPAQGGKSQDQSDHLEALGRVGGYGYLLGDEGSAYDVGRQTIKQVLRLFDHQQQKEYHPRHCQNQTDTRTDIDEIEQSDLVGFLLKQFRIDRLDNLLGSVYAIKDEHERKLRIAEVSRFVMGCAFRGDQPDRFAQRILEIAAKRLSELVSDLSELYNLKPEEMVLCLGGGMWAYDEFKKMVISTMKADWNADWGWIEIVDRPDQVAVLSLVE